MAGARKAVGSRSRKKKGSKASKKKGSRKKTGKKRSRRKKIKRGSKERVYKGTAQRTKGNATKAQIIDKGAGKGGKRYVFKGKSARAKIRYRNSKLHCWTDAMMRARKELNLTGFHPVKKGSALYNKTQKMYKNDYVATAGGGCHKKGSARRSRPRSAGSVKKRRSRSRSRPRTV